MSGPVGRERRAANVTEILSRISLTQLTAVYPASQTRESAATSYNARHRPGHGFTLSPVSPSIWIRRLYFARRSDWVIDPILI